MAGWLRTALSMIGVLVVWIVLVAAGAREGW